MPQNRVPKEIFSFWISTCADCCVYTLWNFCKTAPAKIQPHTQKFCKNKSAKFNRHLHFSRQTCNNFLNKTKNFICLKKWKSPKNFFLLTEKNFGLYYSNNCLCVIYQDVIKKHDVVEKQRTYFFIVVFFIYFLYNIFNYGVVYRFLICYYVL